MALLSLPSEILILIFDYIPPYYFRQDPSILYISKAWYTYAHAAFLRRLRLTSKNLPQFPPEDEDLHNFIQDHTTSLSLKFYGEIDYKTPILALLDQFTDGVSGLRKLRKFGFTACFCSTPGEETFEIEDDDRFPLDYLMAESICTLVWSLPCTVTTLKLDTIGSALMGAVEGPPFGRESKRVWHVCPMFKLMAALRVLKVRMDTACGAVFQGPQIKKITLNMRSRDKDGRKLGRVVTGCDFPPLVSKGGPLEERLFMAGRLAVLTATSGTKECVILGERDNGGLYEIDCGAEVVKNYSDKAGREWGIGTDDYDYVGGDYDHVGGKFPKFEF